MKNNQGKVSGFIDLSHPIESGAVPAPVRGMGSFPVSAYAAISEED